MPKKYDGPGELIRAGWNMNGVTQLSVNPQIDIELWVLTGNAGLPLCVALPRPLPPLISRREPKDGLLFSRIDEFASQVF